MVIQDLLPTNVVIQDILPTNVVIQDILPTNVVIQDILPTNERLHKIRLIDSPLYGHCGEPDTVQHRVTACGEGASIWLWTERRVAWILRIDPAHIHRTGQRDPSSDYGHLRDTGRCYGYWPKWCGTESKRVEHALSKITATFCDGHAGRRIRPNIAGPTPGTILRHYDHRPIRRTHSGVAASG
jgi:hypothetical protein